MFFRRIATISTEYFRIFLLCFSLFPMLIDESRLEGSSAIRSNFLHASTTPSMPRKSSRETSRQLSCRFVREERPLFIAISGRIPSSNNTSDSNERFLFLIACNICSSAARLPRTISSRLANASFAPRYTL
ncbi:hypothetical protein PMAYCL1PPCAC_30809 [Pristionchus mayeri]|uniref:Uncharacterized protein n=1 Tax=Pristionchus mayeri TaxID=1317129 RepID=A0AAN5IDI6_9BILA|nr:hypothetical protein PMAYCL1PPCAC_30809 [Pristionchus mayeri]